MIEQKGVAIDDRIVNDISARLTGPGDHLLRVGKRRFGRVVIS